MIEEKEIGKMTEQVFQQEYIEGKRTGVVAGVYDILTSERNIAGNPALAIRICDYVSDEAREETAREILNDIKEMSKIAQGYEYSFGNLLPVLVKVFEKYGIEVDE